MSVCEYCRRIAFKSTDQEAPTRVTDTEFQKLPPRLTIVESVEPGSISGRYDHQPSVLKLIESSSSCSMCRTLLELFTDPGAISQAKECANSGSYTKVQIVAAEGDSNNVEARAALKHVEITSNARVWTSKPFAISLDQTRYADRAIWKSLDPVKFEDRCTVIQDWMSDCDDSHPNCRNNTPEQINLPARLIHVDSSGDESTHPRLVPTHELVDEVSNLRYVALSHCWGTSAMPLRTTKDTLDAHLTGIAIDRFPKTFRDAITITQGLGIHFLWIDSLCIIQDDEADWQQEAAKMASVYRHACLTIAAASARNSQEGCYIESQCPTLQFEAINPVTRQPGKPGRAHVRAPYPRSSFTEDPVSRSPIAERGWTFQEMVLSTRTVFFAKDQMYWHCNSLYASEDGTMEIAPVQDDNAEIIGPVLGSWRRPYRTEEPKHAFSTWWSWVTEFNARLLTRSSDVLPALAGIIEYFEHLIDDEPLVGLWRKSIVYDLLWVASGDSEHFERRPGIPTWSWAAIDAYLINNPTLQTPFANDSQAASNAVYLYLQGCSEDMTEEEVMRPIFPAFVDARIEYEGVRLVSPLRRAELVLRGRVLPCIYDIDRRLMSLQHKGDATPDRSHTSLHNHGDALDVQFDLEVPAISTRLLCVFMTVVGDMGEVFLFLVLREVEGSEGHYARVGIALRSEIVRMDIAGMELKEVVIV